LKQVENKLSHKLFTIFKYYESGTKCFSPKVWKSRKAAQKAADKEADGWEVMKLNTGYTEYVKDTEYSTAEINSVFCQVSDHLKYKSLKVEDYSVQCEHEHNVIRHVPLGETPRKQLGDESLVVELRIRYSIDIMEKPL
jgi:hypothetical protein